METNDSVAAAPTAFRRVTPLEGLFWPESTEEELALLATGPHRLSEDIMKLQDKGNIKTIVDTL